MTWKASVYILLLASLCLAWPRTVPADQTPAGGQAASYSIASIKVEQTADNVELRVHGDRPPTYTMYELFDPLRVVIDIADASLAATARLPANLPLGPIQAVRSRLLAKQQPPITRLEVVLARDQGYTVERQGNDILIAFAKQEAAAPSAQAPPPPAAPAGVAAPATASRLEDIVVDRSDPALTRIFLRLDGPPPGFRQGRLPGTRSKPARLYLDLPGLRLAAKARHRLEVGTALARIRAAQRQEGVRVVLDSNLGQLFDYEVEKQDRGLLVTVAEPAGATALLAELSGQQAAASSRPAKPAPAADELIKPVIPRPRPAKAKPAIKAKVPAKKKAAKKKVAADDSFAFAGYHKQKITVDFFKIDLHNVFRLFGEISGLNIVVDEGVRGSLTLALNNVPWDFALDIILNLKDLQKEERFNTIVISPKAKQFVWPKSASDQIAFKTEGGGKLAALSVKERLQTPKEVVEAKKLIRQARKLDRAGDYSGALPLYEQAFRLWPENGQLAERMAAICLVHLGMNAKAVHYAKAALQADPTNRAAALQAAIGLANMQKVAEAKRYFDLAIASDRPASEALISYAAFAEQHQSYRGALALLARHEELYGDTLDTMIARARIYDKMGETARAVQEYRTIQLSGYRLPPDLKKYIQARIAAADKI